jgi:hypothetical protein
MRLKSNSSYFNSLDLLLCLCGDGFANGKSIGHDWLSQRNVGWMFDHRLPTASSLLAEY